ncbi:Reverse transcriptase domain-containing protein [Abeliophyllum distichum]|uniref:Reverse transcriptase domain-containing protein n=1 Tax=Abeliophyllum distichum TaxID=126358 RepID=A0ABD1UNL7_9LAMI
MKHPLFISDMQNVRLGLAIDEFNPFGDMSLAYNMWPVVVTVYNLPHWLCMKPEYLMLTLLISGPKTQVRSSLSGWSGQGYMACPTCNKETPSVLVIALARTLKVSDMMDFHDHLVLILYKFEQSFLSAFFDIMIHLVMHLPEEAIIGGAHEMDISIRAIPKETKGLRQKSSSA